jgi:hypothetical protein
MELKCFELSSNQFDFILDSLAPHMGNQTTKKCIQSNDGLEIEYTKCSARILDEKIHAAYQAQNVYLNMFNSIVQKYQQTHRCSCKTLICLTIVTWKRLSPIVSNSYLNLASISKYLKAILNKAIDETTKDLKNLEFVKQLVVKSNVNDLKIKSRHFGTSNRLKNFKFNLNSNSQYFRELLCGLCRSQEIYSDIIYEILEYHENEDLKFDSSTITIVSDLQLCKKSGLSKTKIDRSSDHLLNFKLFTGILFEMNASTRYTYVQLFSRHDSLNTILLDSSLDYNYVHTGFNFDLKSSKHTINITDSLNTPYMRWLNTIKSTLIKFKINFLLASGGIDDNLIEFCRMNSVLALENVDFKTLRKISNKTLVYLNDLTDEYVIKLKTQLYDEKYLRIHNESLLCVHLKINSFYKTQAKLLQNDLQRCLKRVDNVLKSEIFLNGCGYIEDHFASLIPKLNLNEFEATSITGEQTDFDVAKEVLTHSFRDFLNILKANAISDDDGGAVYDDISSKIQAYKTALYIIELFMSSDVSIHD